MARPFLIIPVLKVKVVWTVAIVFILWSSHGQGQNAVPDCSDARGDLLLHFPNSDFPGITPDILKIAFQPNVTPSCHLTVLGHRTPLDFYVIIPFDDCGTRNYYLPDHGGQRCYENQVEYNYYVFAERAFRKTLFPIVCCRPFYFVKQISITNATLVTEFDFQADINFYQDESLAVRIDTTPYTVTVGSWVVIGISVKAESPYLFADDDLKLVITKCTLDPTGHPDVEKNITIIDDNCPVNPSWLTTYTINATTEAFRLKVYKWFGYPTVYVTCRLRICSASAPDPLCDRSCPKSRRRRRRSIAPHVTSAPVKTVSKSLLLIDSD